VFPILSLSSSGQEVSVLFVPLLILSHPVKLAVKQPDTINRVLVMKKYAVNPMISVTKNNK